MTKREQRVMVLDADDVALCATSSARGIIFSLVSYSGFYGVAVRDFGLMLGALTLARLASVYDPPLRRRG